MNQAFIRIALTDIFTPSRTLCRVALPLFSGKVAAGFPSPADDYVEKTLDMNEFMHELALPYRLELEFFH